MSAIQNSRLSANSRLTENLHEEVDSFEIGKFIVVSIDAHAEEKASIATVHYLVVLELRAMKMRETSSSFLATDLYEVGLILLIPRRN